MTPLPQSTWRMLAWSRVAAYVLAALGLSSVFAGLVLLASPAALPQAPGLPTGEMGIVLGAGLVAAAAAIARTPAAQP